MNVILVSSDHAIPTDLTKHFQMHPDDIHKYIYAAEDSPTDMYKLLVNDWNVGYCINQSLWW